MGFRSYWKKVYKPLSRSASFAKEESLCYIPAHIIMVRLCDAPQLLLFCMLFLLVALCLASPVSTRKQLWQSWDKCHISHHCYTKSICLLQKVLLIRNSMSPVKTPGFGSFVQTFIDIQLCECGKETFVCFFNRQICSISPQKQPYPCKVCSKLSWSCMGPLGRTMLTAPLRWSWEEDEAGDWILSWTTPPEVKIGNIWNIACGPKLIIGRE